MPQPAASENSKQRAPACGDGTRGEIRVLLTAPDLSAPPSIPATADGAFWTRDAVVKFAAAGVVVFVIAMSSTWMSPRQGEENTPAIADAAKQSSGDAPRTRDAQGADASRRGFRPADGRVHRVVKAA